MLTLMHNSTVATAPAVTRPVRERATCGQTAVTGFGAGAACAHPMSVGADRVSPTTYVGAGIGAFWLNQDATKKHHSQRRKRP